MSSGLSSCGGGASPSRLKRGGRGSSIAPTRPRPAQRRCGRRCRRAGGRCASSSDIIGISITPVRSPTTRRSRWGSGIWRWLLLTKAFRSSGTPARDTSLLPPACDGCTSEAFRLGAPKSAASHACLRDGRGENVRHDDPPPALTGRGFTRSDDPSDAYCARERAVQNTGRLRGVGRGRR